MLRDGQGFETTELRHVLKQFGVAGDSAKICDFEVLTPDSFAWIVRLTDGEYCLHAEDYAPGLEHVLGKISDFTHGASGQLVPVKTIKQFEALSAVQAAEVYVEPKQFGEMQPYIADSGVDLVFLFKLERPNRWQI